MSSNHYLSLKTVSGMLLERRLSPVELVESTLGRIDACQEEYQAFVTVLPEPALERAKTAEKEIREGKWRGPLHGIPIAVKDSISMLDAPTSEGMHIHRERFIPVNATVVDRLEQAGAIIVGKLSMYQAAMAVNDPEMPRAVNPWNPNYWPGASSSGAGAATAAGLCFGSLGTDSGGSIRIPSAACNLTGLKPTWGRVSRSGVCPQSPSLDHVGPIARSVEDCALILRAIMGPDLDDPTTTSLTLPDYKLRSNGLKGIRIGVDERWIFESCDPDVERVLADAIDVFKRLGASIVPVVFPIAPEIAKAWSNICSTEAAISHAATYPSLRAQYAAEITAVLDRGREMTVADLAASYAYRDLFKGRMGHFFANIDTLICPVIPATIPTNSGWDEIAGGKGDFERYTKFTVPFNLAGSPCLAVPGGFDGNGIPVGFQLVGPLTREDLLFEVGHAYQSATDWHLRHPEIRVHSHQNVGVRNSATDPA